MFKYTLVVISLLCLYAMGKPIIEEIDGQEYVEVQPPYLKVPLPIHVYDDSVCEKLTTNGCRTVTKMTLYGVECDFCVIEKDEVCDGFKNLFPPCDDGLSCYPSKSSRVLAPSSRSDLMISTCQDTSAFDYVLEYMDRYGKVELNENASDDQVELFEKTGLAIEENDYEKYRKEAPIGSPFDKNYIPLKFSSSEEPCTDHYRHWETIENKHRKNWKPFCADDGLYEISVPQCTTDFECWCTNSRGIVIEENVRDHCGSLE